jgi:hypothetical protein
VKENPSRGGLVRSKESKLTLNGFPGYKTKSFDELTSIPFEFGYFKG